LQPSYPQLHLATIYF